MWNIFSRFFNESNKTQQLLRMKGDGVYNKKVFQKYLSYYFMH